MKAMKNKHVSKEDKIKARLLYEAQQKEEENNVFYTDRIEEYKDIN